MGTGCTGTRSKAMRKLLLISLFLGLFASTTTATHMSGGEIYWDCIGPNQYRITMVIYRDCFGINVDPSYTLQVQSPCGNTTMTVTTPGGVEISQLCDIELPNSTCNGGTLPGIQQYIYTGTITLPPCNFWTISYTNIFRNAAIVNLTNPGAQRTYIRATINTAAAPCNDSPQFTNTAIPYVCLGYPITYSFGAYDPESDSLSYQLIPAMGIAGAPLNYVNPHSGAQPIPGLTLNPATGEVNFTLTQMGNWVVAVRVNHWVNGVIVGTVMRDMQFVAYPCDNIPPDPTTGLVQDLSGMATATGPRAIEVCESGSFCFDMVISDPNTNNVLSAFSNVQQNLPGATFTYTGTNPITATVCWTAAPGTSGFFPFIVNVNDGACPIPAFQTYIYTVRVLPGLGASLTVVDESCLGTGDGSITAVVNAGTAPYTYTWSNGSSEASISGGPGDYSVVIEDSNGCTSAPLAGSIGTAALPNEADAGPNATACVHVPFTLQGSVVNATGGVWSGGQGNFSGTWPNVSYTPSEADLLAGGAMLTLTTTGNNGCPPASAEVFLSLVNSFENVSVTATDATCYNTANGSASVVPDSPEFTYLWNDGAAQTTATASNLAAGTYQVLITDGFGCSTSLEAFVGPTEAISIADLSATDEGCLGDGNGSAAVVATGGTAPYSYLWNTGATTSTITAGSGDYSVSVTDANGCAPAQGLISIAAQGLPNVANAGPDQVACLNTSVALNGSVTNATGGTWSGGAGTFQGSGLSVSYTPSAAEVASGTVQLTLTTTGNTVCPPASDVVSISLSNSFLQAAITSVDATCNDNANGSATFSPEAPGLSYLWNDAAAQTTATALGLAPGNYQITVTDALGCDTTMSAFIGPQEAITIASLSATDEGCLGDGNGTATALGAGGTAPYSYLWNTGATTASITAGSGTYTVSITDSNGCTPAQGSITIAAQGLPNAANAGPDLVGCLNALPITLNGTVTNATGGTWSGGSGTFLGTGLSVQYMPTPAEIQAGSVSLTLTTTGNSVCPTASDALTIQLSNSFLQASITASNVSCNGLANGSLAFSPDLPGNSYLWNDPQAQSTATAIGLPAGTWSITVSDALGCDTTLSATITEPPTLAIASLMQNPVQCNGGTTGSAVLVVQGGTPGYTVLWSNGATGMILSNLAAGSYSATVTDALGCSVQATANIAEPAPILLTAQVPDTVCVNAPQVLTAQASGGNGNLTVSWSGLGTGSPLTANFSASQQVFVTVSDQVGCTGPTLSFPVTVLDLFSATLSTSGGGTFCPGASTSVSANLSGYPGSYTIQWPALGTTGPGPFTVPVTGSQQVVAIVTDACGNTLQSPVNIVLDVPPSVQLPPIIAEGCAPLSVTMPDLQMPSGITYAWDLGNGSTSGSAQPTVTYPVGSYAIGLVVTTAAGCSTSSSTNGQVIAHASPNAAFTASTWSTNIDNASINFTDQSSGGVTAWSWTFGDGGTSSVNNPLYTYLEVGTFEVELWVQNIHGCADSTVRTVEITPVYDVTVPTAFTPNPNGPGGGGWIPGDLSNDVFYPFVRFVDEFRMRIFNRWGELIFESNDLSIGWDGWYRGQLSPQDVYVVQTWVRFLDGKEVQKLSDLTLFR